MFFSLTSKFSLLTSGCWLFSNLLEPFHMCTNVNDTMWRTVFGLAAALCLVACGEVPSQPPPTSAPSAESIPSTVDGSVPALTPDERLAAEKFYHRKTVSIIVGSGAGGGFDTTAR